MCRGEKTSCRWVHQTTWFIGLWLAGVAATAMVAGLVKLGMSCLK